MWSEGLLRLLRYIVIIRKMILRYFGPIQMRYRLRKRRAGSRVVWNWDRFRVKYRFCLRSTRNTVSIRLLILKLFFRRILLKNIYRLVDLWFGCRVFHVLYFLNSSNIIIVFACFLIRLINSCCCCCIVL